MPAIVVFAFAVTGYYAWRTDEWIVMTDELLYVKLALGIGDDLSLVPRVRGDYYAVFNQLYPLLLAPFYAVLDIPGAFKAGHLVNALLMASTAVPAYLLARAVELPRYAGYAVAALTVAVPWMSMSSILWTEAVAYPAFAWAVLACQRCIATPGPRNDWLALAGLALAFFARTQFALLVAVLPAAIVLHELRMSLDRQDAPIARRLRDALLSTVSGHRVLAAGYAAAALLAVVALGDPREVLGNYGATSYGDLLPAGTLDGAGRLVDAMAVGIGVIPLVLATGWAAGSVIRPASRARHAFAALALILVPAVVIQAASFALRFSNSSLNDRYVFYVVPVLFVGMALCLLEERRRWPGVAVAGLAMAAIVDVLVFEPQHEPPLHNAPTGAFYPVLDGRSYELGQFFGIADLAPATLIEVGTLVATAAIVAGLVWLPRRLLFAAVVVPVLLFCAAETRYVLARMADRDGSGGIVTGSPRLEDRDWIDDALPEGASATLVPVFVGDSPFVTERTWWQAEFWNTKVEDAYSLDGTQPTYTPFSAETLTVDPDSGKVGAEDPAPYLVVSSADLRFHLAARETLASGFAYLELIRPARPYRAEWTTTDLLPDGWTLRGATVRIRLFPGPAGGGSRTVRLLLSAPADVKSPRRFTLRSGPQSERGTLVPPDGRTEVSVNACVPRGGPADVTLDVSGANELPDGREIGLRVLDVDVADGPPSACRDRRARPSARG